MSGRRPSLDDNYRSPGARKLAQPLGTLFLATLALTPVGATVYTVTPDGKGDLPTIQSAIDAAADADVVELGDGVFTGDGNTGLDFRGKAITLKSGGGDPKTCIIDCLGSQNQPHRGIYFRSGEGHDSVVRGITVTGGYAPIDDEAMSRGGGIRCENASPTIVDCIIHGNSADTEGGGIYCVNSTAVIDSCTIRDNSAYRYGGIGWTTLLAPEISRCAVTGNTTEEDGGGMGGQSAGTAVISDCVVSGNHAGGCGGGIAGGPEAYTMVFNCRVFRNTAMNGGGIWCFSGYVVDCTLQDNVAEMGGGISSVFGDIVNCIITGNVGAADGAGMGGGVWADNYTSLSGSTVSANRSDLGGGIYSCGMMIHSTLVRGNCASVSADELFLNEYTTSTTLCSAFDEAGVGGPGNLEYHGEHISDDPLQCGPESCDIAPTSLGDYALQLSSPCLPENNSCGILIGALGVGCAVAGATGRAASFDSGLPVSNDPGGRLGDGSTEAALWNEAESTSDRVAAILVSSVSPNPTDGSVRFTIDLQQAATVQAHVFDVSGRRVRTVMDRELPAGVHHILTDLVDQGGPLAGGLYYLCLSADGRRWIRKVVVAR